MKRLHAHWWVERVERNAEVELGGRSEHYLTWYFIWSKLGLIHWRQLRWSGSSKSWATLTGFLSCCSCPFSLPPPPDAFSLPGTDISSAGCGSWLLSEPLLGISARFPQGCFLRRESFSPLHDGIFSPCRNGLPLISTSSTFSDQFPRRIFCGCSFFHINYL